MMSKRNICLIIWGTQFIASLLTLSLPPFFALFIPKAFPGTPSWFGGLVFAAPLAAGAWASPRWGRLADIYGRLPMAIRAHLGLSVALFLAALAPNAWVFLLALVLQGALGGTYSANRALLLERVAPDERARALETLESAPRLALVFGPLLASAIGPELIQPVYLFALAPIPLFAAASLSLLKFAEINSPDVFLRERAGASRVFRGEFTLAKIAVFALFFGGGIFAPFAVTWTQERLPGLPLTSATFLALLPNIAFSLLAFTPARWARFLPLPKNLGIGLSAQGLALVGLVFCAGFFTQFIGRMLYSLLFVVNWRRIHADVAKAIPVKELGRTTGELDAVQRWAALFGSGISTFLWSALPSRLALPAIAGALMLVVVLVMTNRQRSDRGN